jgi:hypothetical protein
MTHWQDDDLFGDLRRRLEHWTDAVAQRAVDPLEGAREIYRVWQAFVQRAEHTGVAPYGNREGSDELRFLCGVDSEADRFPLGAERSLWSEDALREADRTLGSMRDAYRVEIEAIAARLQTRLKEGWMSEYL